MNKYRFASGARWFNLINIRLLIFPFGRCTGHHPRIISPHHPRSSVLLVADRAMLRRTRTTRRASHRNTILLAISPRLFVHTFVLRLLTANRAPRKPATSYARLHFINFSFLRFSLHTACCRVARQIRKLRGPRKPRELEFFSSTRRIREWRRRGERRAKSFH